jgi:DNA repair and recombination protein RAD52
MFTPEQTRELDAPLDKAVVKSREQAGRKLSYIEGWHAIAEANRIFGFDGWSRELVRLEETNRELVELKGSNGPYKQWRVGYLAVVEITVGGVLRQGTGFGSGMAKPEALGEAVESAIKEAETDAMKRGLMTFGNPFGLALYDKEQRNVEVAPPPPDKADVYTDAAIAIIRTFSGNANDLKTWWNDQGSKRRECGLGQKHVDALLAEVVKRRDELNAQQEAA